MNDVNNSTSAGQTPLPQMKQMQEISGDHRPRIFYKLNHSIADKQYQYDIAFNGQTLIWIRYSKRNQTIIGSPPPLPPFDIEMVRLPSGVGQHSTPEELVERILRLLKRVVWLTSEADYYFASLYTFATWHFDLYAYICYLALIGPSGVGKSIASAAVEELCFSGVKIGGADSEATFFRNIELYRGTMCIDESQMDSSNPGSLIHKVLTEGAQHRGSISRNIKRPNDADHTPKRFAVYGPKVFSGLWLPSHEAILNRTYEIKMAEAPAKELPREQPTDVSWLRDAVQLRNDMLLYRQRRLTGEINTRASDAEAQAAMNKLGLGGREQQVFGWLFKECPSKTWLSALADAMTKRRVHLVETRTMGLDAQVLLKAFDLATDRHPRLKEIVSALDGYEGKLHSKTVRIKLQAHGLSNFDRDKNGTFLLATQDEIAIALKRLGIDPKERS